MHRSQDMSSIDDMAFQQLQNDIKDLKTSMDKVLSIVSMVHLNSSKIAELQQTTDRRLSELDEKTAQIEGLKTQIEHLKDKTRVVCILNEHYRKKQNIIYYLWF